MRQLLKRVNTFLYNDFVFSDRYRVWRHVIYWSFHITIWAVFWTIMSTTNVHFFKNLFKMLLWLPMFIFFSYPMVYYAIPRLLLKGKLWQFFLLVLAWGALGLYMNAGYRTYVVVPVLELMQIPVKSLRAALPQSFLCMTTSAASPMIIKFFKLWTAKQRDRMQVQQEKISTELQLLKAQVHPHFLISTLNNIYTCSINRSSDTPTLILKLSSLLSYMLYDCKSEDVRLENEIAIMRNYIDLESERFNNRIEISWSVEGNIRDQFIAPLLLMPFLENAFKYCAAPHIQKPWLAFDASVKNETLRCKIAYSKDENIRQPEADTSIQNVKKRLGFIYPDRYELKLNDEGSFFVVSLLIRLTASQPAYMPSPMPETPVNIQMRPA